MTGHTPVPLDVTPWCPSVDVFLLDVAVWLQTLVKYGPGKE